MTREEAISELKYLDACSYVDEFEPSEKEALKMAIKALEQEPKTGKEKFFDAIHTIEEFCWQFRPDCKGCPLFKYYYCAIKEFMPYSEKYVRELIEEWEHEKR